ESQKVLNFFKHNGDTVKIYSDKKIFTVDAVLNRRNDRFLAEQEVSPIMVLGIVASDGNKMPPHFFRSNEKVTLMSTTRSFGTGLAIAKEHIPNEQLCVHPGRSPGSHVQEGSGVLQGKWPPSGRRLLALSSPDVNPLDFAVWGFLEGKTNSTSHTSVEALKATITRSGTTCRRTSSRPAVPPFVHVLKPSSE
ncbi:Uncharacterized protein FKW44_024692, partial [Caligus rogercresseyi]